MENHLIRMARVSAALGAMALAGTLARAQASDESQLRSSVTKDLNDPKPDVRKAALEKLKNPAEAATWQMLAGSAARDPDPSVRVAAVTVLCSAKDTDGRLAQTIAAAIKGEKDKETILQMYDAAKDQPFKFAILGELTAWVGRLNNPGYDDNSIQAGGGRNPQQYVEQVVKEREFFEKALKVFNALSGEGIQSGRNSGLEVRNYWKEKSLLVAKQDADLLAKLKKDASAQRNAAPPETKSAAPVEAKTTAPSETKAASTGETKSAAPAETKSATPAEAKLIEGVPGPDAELLEKADYAGAADLWKQKKDKDAAWRAEAAQRLSADWLNALAALNKKITPETKLEAFLPDQRLHETPIRSFDARAGVVLDMGKGATSTVSWKNISTAERMELLRLAKPDDAPATFKAQYCLALLHGKVAEASDLYEQAGKPDPQKGLVEAYLASEAGKHTEEIQKAFVQSCMDVLEKVKQSGNAALLASFLRLNEARLAENPFAEPARAKIAELKAEFEKAKADAAKTAQPPAADPANGAQPPATDAPPVQTADGRKVLFKMDFSKPNWGKIVPVNGNDLRGEVIADPTGGTGKVLSAKILYGTPGTYVGAAAHTELPDNVSYTIGPNTYFETEVYYEGPSDPAAYLEVKGQQGEKRTVGQVALGELKEKTWQKISVQVCETTLHAALRREKDLPRNGDRYVQISFHADFGCTRHLQKLLFRNLVIYEAPEKK